MGTARRPTTHLSRERPPEIPGSACSAVAVQALPVGGGWSSEYEGVQFLSDCEGHLFAVGTHEHGRRRKRRRISGSLAIRTADFFQRAWGMAGMPVTVAPMRADAVARSPKRNT